jgi:hypothetical protein
MGQANFTTAAGATTQAGLNNLRRQRSLNQYSKFLPARLRVTLLLSLVAKRFFVEHRPRQILPNGWSRMC